jgi:hypothetical protein
MDEYGKTGFYFKNISRLFTSFEMNMIGLGTEVFTQLNVKQRTSGICIHINDVRNQCVLNARYSTPHIYRAGLPETFTPQIGP